jgi:transposase InsO family protein
VIERPFADISLSFHCQFRVDAPLSCPLKRQRLRTRVELANAMFEYLEIFHTRQRRHSALGMLTPTEFETAYHQSIA